MNRLAIHESAAPDLSPTELVDLALRTGFDSIGLKVAHSRGADLWWRKGAGSAELSSMVEHLLTNRVSVLDVGRIELAGPPDPQSYRGVLDLSSRLGARYVTACGVPRAAEESSVEEEFGQLVRDADDYQLVPLLIDQPGTGVTTPAQALELVRGTGGGAIITVSTRQAALDIEAQVLEAGNRLGYLRLLADDLDSAVDDAVAGLLATVPVHVPIAVGSPTVSRGGDLDARARRWSSLIDRMLEHPLARAHREASAADRTVQP
jgi:sugar phosphate isomerase/epimerase